MSKIEEKNELIFDWNTFADRGKIVKQKVMLDDETLRDGLQSPSVKNPTIAEKIKILHLMEELGIDNVNIGLPGAGEWAVLDSLALAKEIVDNKMKIRANCAARTVIVDINPIIEISQKVGMPIEASLFIGSSPIRQYAEDWTLDMMLRNTEEAVSYAVKHGLPVMYVTEDTTRAHPDVLKKLYTTAIECGARAICVCDTVGHATPDGVKNLIDYIKQVVAETREKIRIDWHGHRDRGLDVINSLTAVFAGADEIHGTALGIGERVGNAAMDLILVNLRLLGIINRDLTKLKEYCETVSKAVGVPIPKNYPVIGEDAFRTATGVHAAAVIKAFNKNDEWLANLVYSGVPAHLFGAKQKIEIGPMSGKSNVIYWLKDHGYEPTEALVNKIFEAAKRTNRVFTDEEVNSIIKS